MKKLSFGIVLISSCFGLFAQDSTGVGSLVTSGQIIYELKKIQPGISSFSRPQAKKGETSVPDNAIDVTESGEIKILNPALLTGDLYVLELKTVCEDSVGTSTFLNQIQLENRNNTLVTSIVSDKIEMADGWRKDGKIWIVIFVSIIVFSVMFGFLIYIERKLKKAEKLIQEQR